MDNSARRGQVRLRALVPIETRTTVPKHRSAFRAQAQGQGFLAIGTSVSPALRAGTETVDLSRMVRQRWSRKH